MIWHNSTSSEVLSELRSNLETGLSSSEANLRLEQFGKNELHDFSKKGFVKYLIKEATKVINIAVIVTALIYLSVTLALGESGWVESVVLIASTIINAVISALSKYRTTKELNTLRNSVISYTTVIRDGVETAIPSWQLVPGDIMVLKTGDYIKADGRLVDSYVLKCDEFQITAEAVPADKIHDVLFDDITPVEDRFNMVYSGSCVVNGKGLAVVTETAYSTELGKREKIEKHINDNNTPLTLRLLNAGKIVSTIAYICAVIVFIFGVVLNLSSYDVSFSNTVLSYLLIALSFVIVGSSDGFAGAFTTSITCTVKNLKKQGVTVKNLNIAEELKDVTVLCTDKTGSLTTGEISVSKVFTGKDVFNLRTETPDDLALTVLRLALICSNLNPDEHIERHTNNMESAIEDACKKFLGMSKIDIDGLYPKLDEIPFDSARRLMTTVSAIEGTPYAIIKGAPEVLAERCNNADAEAINKIATDFAKDGLQVIAVAVKPLSEIPANPSSDELEYGLTFTGLIGLEDEIDQQTFLLCHECRENGIKVVMITGDHLDTAVATAKKMGIVNDGDSAISGEHLAEMDDDTLSENVGKYTVFARVYPEDKLRIVNTLKSSGERVAITGDSANDTLALRQADVGCALGLSASDIVKDSADIVINDNRFASLVWTVKESGRILTNVKKTVCYILTYLVSLALTVIFGLFIFGNSPFSAATILLINLLTLVLPKLAFSAEESREGLTFSHSNNKFFDKSFFIKTLVPSLVFTLLALIAYAITLSAGTAFATLSICYIFHALSLSLKTTLFSKNILKFKIMPAVCLINLILLIILVVTPAGTILAFSGLNTAGWIMMLISAVVSILTNEIIKLIFSPKGDLPDFLKI